MTELYCLVYNFAVVVRWTVIIFQKLNYSFHEVKERPRIIRKCLCMCFKCLPDDVAIAQVTPCLEAKSQMLLQVKACLSKKCLWWKEEKKSESDALLPQNDLRAEVLHMAQYRFLIRPAVWLSGGYCLLVETKTSKQLLDGLPWSFVQTFMVPGEWIILTLAIPWLFL